MKLRNRKSEYQHCYLSPSKEYFKTVYEEQLTYRLKRRNEENFSNVIQWDSDSSDNTPETSPKIEVADSEMQSCVVAEEDLTERLTEGSSQKENHSQEPEIPSPSGENVEVLASSDKTKNLSAINLSREKSKERPPFLSYGWADEQIETGRKRTFNIQAPQKCLYPGVLKRQAYSNMEKLKHKQKKERRALSALSAPVRSKKATDSSEWQSEYQRCYSSQSSRPSTASSQKRGCKSKRSFQAVRQSTR